VATGLYDSASEVIREALRFMQTNEYPIHRMKLEELRRTRAEGERDIAADRYRVIGREELGPFMQEAGERARARIVRETL
jgi:putative addiction module CopG family antidote